jgi:hypothetical protein
MGAIRLIDEIAENSGRWSVVGGQRANGNGHAVAHETRPAPRVLCFAQSHGGNVLALMTNLLGGDRATRKQLLDLVRGVPGKSNGGPWHESWRRACERLDSDASAAELLGGRQLDLVTFGTPIRYGWDSGGYDQLLHIVNQRPVPELPPWRGRLPRTLNDVVDGRYGDWVHQIGIAGSNFPLLPLRWRRWRAERNLAALLQRGEPSYHVRRRIRNSLRVPDEGPTLLADFGVAQRGQRLRHIFGHGIYTHTQWMPFHLEQAAATFYGSHAPAQSVTPAGDHSVALTT